MAAPFNFRIAKIDLTGLTLIYQETFRKFNTNLLARVVFVDESLYFAVTTGNLIYPSASNIPQMIPGGYKHGILFSSDVSRACYTLSASLPQPAITISTSGSLAPIPDPFTIDSALVLSQQTLTIIKLYLPAMSSWASYCPTQEFSYPFLTNQNLATITLNLDTMSAVPIDLFRTTAQCTPALIPKFQYSFYTAPLASLDLSIDPDTGHISPNCSSVPSANVQIKVMGTVQNFQWGY